MDMPDGFIPLPPRVEPQAAFRPLLDDLRRTLARPPFERAVHSVYLYGSVARGEAITGRSDLDLTLVLRDPPSPELAAQLETARLALQVALALNGDYAQVLEDYARRLESASSEEERRLQREAAKKLIRSSDILRGETESVWPETLEHYLALFRARHPGQAPALEYFKAVLDGQVTDPAVFIERLRAFSAWMQRQA
ncbi:nucleotidyltransferase domain-containing protein [Pseudomonas aeruginosa]|nr:nucleotidyltransferase domain-containing protein [Pseudomonas aeruginosa]